MDKGAFRRPARNSDEFTMLRAFLDFHRDALLRNIGGVSDEDLRRPMVQSGTSLLGLVKHLACVEVGWFAKTFAGRDVAYPFGLTEEDDPDADLRVGPGEITDEIVAAYKDACETSRAIVESASLEDLAQSKDRGDISLRWIMLHMIEETARHNGHADILREQIDGVTGE